MLFSELENFLIKLFDLGWALEPNLVMRLPVTFGGTCDNDVIKSCRLKIPRNVGSEHISNIKSKDEYPVKNVILLNVIL